MFFRFCFCERPTYNYIVTQYQTVLPINLPTTYIPTHLSVLYYVLRFLGSVYNNPFGRCLGTSCNVPVFSNHKDLGTASVFYIM